MRRDPCVLPLVGVLVLLVAWAVPSLAATFYVNQATGSDTHPCTAAQPCTTINRAVALMSGGDTVEIAAGLYKEVLVDHLSGLAVLPSGTSWAHATTITAAPGAQVIVTGRPEDKDGIITVTRAHYLIFNGLTLQGSRLVGVGPGFGLLASQTSRHIRLSNSTVRDTAYSGALLANQGSNEIVATTFTANGFGDDDPGKSHGIYVASAHNLIEESLFVENAGYGIHATYESGGVNYNTFRRNRVIGNNKSGVCQYGVVIAGAVNSVTNTLITGNCNGLVVLGTANTVQHNTIVANYGDVGIEDRSGSDLRNNLVVGHAYADIVDRTGRSRTAGTRADMAVAAVGFVEPAQHNYCLRADSPAVDAGVPVDVATDLWLNPRPYGTAPDAGAMEFGGTCFSALADVPAGDTLAPVPVPEAPLEPETPRILLVDDMEEGPWPSGSFASTHPVVTWTTAASHSGQYALQVMGQARYWGYWNAPARVSVRSGAVLDARMWVMTEDLTSGVTLNLWWYDAAGRVLGWSDQLGGKVMGTTPWQEVGGLVTVPAQAVEALVQVRFESTRGVAYVDDVSLGRP